MPEMGGRGRQGGRDVPARDEAREHRGANKLHQRADAEQGHATQQNSSSKRNDGCHLASDVGVVLGLGVQDWVLRGREEGGKGIERGRKGEIMVLFELLARNPLSPSRFFLLRHSLPTSLPPSLPTLSFSAREMPRLVNVSDMKRETNATGPRVNCPEVPKSV